MMRTISLLAVAVLASFDVSAQSTAASKPLPDLMIAVLGPGDGDNALRIRIENRGEGDAGKFSVKLLRGGGLAPVVTSAGPIPAKGMQEIVVRSPTPLTGLGEVELRVNDSNQVAEVNKSNNIARYKLTPAWPK